MKRILTALAVLLPVTAAVLWWGADVRAEKIQRETERVERDRSTKALAAGKMLGVAAFMYSEEHGEKLPPAENWEEALRPYIESGYGPVELLPPLGGKSRRFAMNKAVAGKKLDDISPAEAVLFFESVAPGPSAADNLESLPDLEKDGGRGYTIIYADGHGYNQPSGWKGLLQQPNSRNRIIFGSETSKSSHP